MPPITFTLDLEDHLGQYMPGGRFETVTYRLLDELATLGIRGTVFSTGRVAESAPALLKRVVAAGHELACHSYRHRTLDRETAQSFREETARAKDLLQQSAGTAVRGYRAPVFSLTARTLWAVDEIAGLGFAYSSSVLPASNPLFGFPGAPRTPFRWPNGLLEFPVPVARVGPVLLPFLGGIYLRYLPSWLIGRLLRSRPAASVLWTYSHPYNFDAEEPYHRIADTAAWVSLLLWLNRRGALDKLRRLLHGQPGPALGTLAADAAYVGSLPVFGGPS